MTSFLIEKKQRRTFEDKIGKIAIKNSLSRFCQETMMVEPSKTFSEN